MRKINMLTASVAFIGLMLTTACSDKVEFSEDTLQEATKIAADDGSIQFSTYLGSSTATRAGAAGIQTNEELKNSGFGVFAYYTGKKTYAESQPKWYTDGTGSDNMFANFMFNQKVEWKTDENYEGYVNGNGKSGDEAAAWVYSPVKYWPNEVGNSEGKVDDQTGDAPKTWNEYDGKVSFFAYAPYVDFSTFSTTNGIVAINGKTTITGNEDANEYEGDPIITYRLPSGTNTSDPQFVDLLWGTLDGTATTNVVGDATPGVTSTATSNNYFYNEVYSVDNMYDSEPKGTFASNIRTFKNDATTTHYTVNADLTKQKTTGSVGFKFKHALSILGGNYSTSDSDIPDPTAGFRAMLDIDNDKGLETGGTKAKETVVTIKYIILKAQSRIDSDNDGTPDLYIADAEGFFNLATGRWNLRYNNDPSNALAKPRYDKANSPSGSDAFTQKYVIGQKVNATFKGGDGTTDYTVTDELNKTLKEPESNTGLTLNQDDDKDAYITTSSISGKTLVGVLSGNSNTKTVFESAADPLVFFPGTYPVITVETCYIVRTKDENLKKGYSEVMQVIKKKLSFDRAVDMGYKYNLLMRIGLTDVKFTASVEQWDKDGTNNFDSNEDNTADMQVEDIYMPINVGEFAFEADKSYDIHVDPSVTSVSIALSGLTKESTYTVSKTGGSGELDPTSISGATSKVIKITGISPNLGTSNVTNTFTVSTGTSIMTFNVIQTAPALTVTASTTAIANGGVNNYDIGISVKAADGTAVTGATYSIESTTGTWDSAPSINSSTGAISVPVNNSGAERTFTIKVTKDDTSGTLVITQSAGSSPAKRR